MEMLIVVTIIAILAAVVLPRFLTSAAAAKSSAYEAEVQTINSQIELYLFHHETGSPPSSMTNAGWSTGGNNYLDYWPEGVPTSDVYGNPYEIDTTTTRIKRN